MQIPDLTPGISTKKGMYGPKNPAGKQAVPAG